MDRWVEIMVDILENKAMAFEDTIDEREQMYREGYEHAIEDMKELLEIRYGT